MKRSLHALLASFILSATLSLPAWAAAGGDLSISESDVSLSTNVFLEGNRVRIWAEVHNNSNNDLLGAVRFSDSSGQIGADQPISALAQSSDAVFVDWSPRTYGSIPVTIKVLPLEATGDNPANNTVVKNFNVQQDSDHDGITNSQDDDDDNDGVNDTEDLYPLDRNESADTDSDGTPNGADTDDDNDGVLDADDAFPLDATQSKDLDKDGIADPQDDDRDGDGVENNQEEQQGTDANNPDSDGDEVSDGEDAWPTDPSKAWDSDGDGIENSQDSDRDGDGTENDQDAAPDDTRPTAELNQNVFIASVNEEFALSATNSSDNGTISEYSWIVNGKNFDGPELKMSFNEAGVYPASLTVTDEAGQTDTKEFKIRVLNMQFVFMGGFFFLLLLLLAFYLIYRYSRRTSNSKKKRST